MTTAIILAAGLGTRAKSETPKQLVKLAGKPVARHSVETFDSHPDIAHIVVAIPPNADAGTYWPLINGIDTDATLVYGGATRNESTRLALAEVDSEHVLVHDAARPMVTHEIIDRVLDALRSGAAAVDTATPSVDTLIDTDGRFARNFPPRKAIQRGQTPQGFRTAVLKSCYRWNSTETTDDCQVVWRAGYPVAVVAGDESNIKITTPLDFAVADRLFQLRTTTPEPSKFDGSVVVVGGTSGIGAELARLTGGRALSRRTGFDVMSPDASQLDADVVVITAGVLDKAPLADQADEAIDEMVDTNLLGTIRTARAAYPHLKRRGGHLILSTSSAYTRGRADTAVYSATKAAVVALAQALADEWPEVRVNAIAPERTATPMRTAAFGSEDPSTLLGATEAAQQVVDILGTTLTGQVFDLRRKP